MPNPLPALLGRARFALSVGSQGALGELLGSSRTTGQRWGTGRSRPSTDQLRELATMVFPHDADLAAELAAAAGSTVEDLGVLEAPPPPPDPALLVDTVVCAAADAMNLPPEAVRPALRAAFRRARLVGLTLEVVDDALNRAPAAAAKAKAPAG